MKTILAAMLLTGTAAFAERPCVNTYEDALAQLAAKYQEAPFAVAITRDGTFLTVTTDANGAWTLIETTPDGRTCLVSDGQNFELVERPPNI
jgi:hypothetical protein